MNKKKLKSKLNRMLNKLCGLASMSCGFDENLAKEFQYQDQLVDFVMSEIEWRDKLIHEIQTRKTNPKNSGRLPEPVAIRSSSSEQEGVGEVEAGTGGVVSWESIDGRKEIAVEEGVRP